MVSFMLSIKFPKPEPNIIAEWDGSHDGDANITGSLIVSKSLNVIADWPLKLFAGKLKTSLMVP